MSDEILENIEKSLKEFTIEEIMEELNSRYHLGFIFGFITNDPNDLPEGAPKEFRGGIMEFVDWDGHPSLAGHLCRVLTQDINEQYTEKYFPEMYFGATIEEEGDED